MSIYYKENWERKTPSKIERYLKKNEEIIYKLGNIPFPKNAILIPPNFTANTSYQFVQIYITNMRIIFEGEKGQYNRQKYDFVTDSYGDWVYTGLTPVVINLEDISQFKYSAKTTKKNTKSWDKILLKQPELLIEKRNGNTRFLIPKAKQTLAEKLTIYLNEFKDNLISEAKKRESALDYTQAILLWEKVGRTKEATRVRKLQAEQRKVDQTIIHGDYVDDRDTIVKDSVLNRTNIRSSDDSVLSKTNVGPSDDKFSKLERLAEMKEKGLIDDDEFKLMKKEILGN